jgi:tetratricopeptide (TPR) repeat protein
VRPGSCGGGPFCRRFRGRRPKTWPHPRIALAVALAVGTLAAGCESTAPAANGLPPYILDPHVGFLRGVAEEVDDGWKACRAGHLARAQREYEAAVRRHSIAGEVGLVEIDVLQSRPEQAVARCESLERRGIETLPLLAACGESYAQAGQPVRAYELYRRTAAEKPDSEFFARRRDALGSLAASALATASRAALARGDASLAREQASRAIAIDAGSADAHRAAAEVERTAGDERAELDERIQAFRIDPSDRAYGEETQRLAMTLEDYPAAITVDETLAATDPEYEKKAEEARLAFRISNWPTPEKRAAGAARVTRGQAAQLLWWLFPEIRASAPVDSPVASDVLDRKDRVALIRAAGLGFLDVDSTTHVVRPDAPLTRVVASAMLLRLVEYLLGKRERPACLQDAASVPRFDSSATVAAAARCRLILPGAARDVVSGRMILAGLQRARALALGGDR